MVTTPSLKLPVTAPPTQSRRVTQPMLTPRQVAVVLLLGDISILAASLSCSIGLRTSQSISEVAPFTGILMVILIGGLYFADTYRPNLQVSGLRAPARALVSNLLAGGLWGTIVYLFGLWGQSGIFGRDTWLLSILILTLWTSLSRVVAAKWLKAQVKANSWLLLGFDRSQQSTIRDFRSLNLADGIVTLLADGQQTPRGIADDNVGQIDDLSVWLTQPWGGILVSSDLDLDDVQLFQLKQARLQGLPVYRLPDLYENYWYKIPAATLQDVWFTFNTGFHLLSNRISLRIKRLGDIVLALAVLLLVSPIMLLTAIAIRLDSPGGVFYSQLRTGKNMKPFRVYKFRSMYQDAERRGAQWAGERDPRITKVGNFIRLVRIDELPQLWNVLRGDMSMIGPRPERPEFDEKLAEEIPHYDVRYLVKPGITGWAQVLYPYGASVEDAYEKLAYDIYYIKNYSLWLDVAIVLKTLRVVLLGKGR